MMPSHLFVISFIRIVQMGLAVFLLFKCYRLHVDHSVTISCPSLKNEIREKSSYSVQWPFTHITVGAPSGCGVNESEIMAQETMSTGFSNTSYLFHVCVVLAQVYGLLAIAFYVYRYEEYELNKRCPAIDLLLSLSVGVLWAVTCYVAWNEYPTMKQETNPDQVSQKLTICQRTAFCSSADSGSWKDVNTYLFLGLANAMSWGISVWFIFVESGLCPEDDDDEWLDSDVDTTGAEALKGNGSFVPFSQMPEYKDMEKRYSIDYGREFGLDGAQLQRKQELLQQQEQQLIGYLKTKHQSFGAKSDFGYIPDVPSVSQDVADKSVKVHNKFNLFKA